MPYQFARVIALGAIITGLAAGCTQPVATDNHSALKDVPLFSDESGYASLNVKVVDERRKTQSVDKVEGFDTIRLTLTGPTTHLSAPRVATITGLTSGQAQYTASPQALTMLRPGSNYQLKAQAYLAADAVLTKAPGTTGFQTVVRGEGYGVDPTAQVTPTLLTLNPGATLNVTVKINSIGDIRLVASANSNVLTESSGPVAVEGDTITVDSGVTQANSPQVKRVELSYVGGTNGITYPTSGSLPSTTVIPAAGTDGATLTWTVPSYIGTNATSDTLGKLVVTGYDATTGGNPITFKTRIVTVYKGGSVSVGLN